MPKKAVETPKRKKPKERGLIVGCFYMQLWCPSEPGFKDGTDELSLEGGEHLFGKNLVILPVRPEFFPANEQSITRVIRIIIGII